MVEPGTGLTALAASPIVLRLLGPTADYIGDSLRNLAEKRAENVRRIFNRYMR